MASVQKEGKERGGRGINVGTSRDRLTCLFSMSNNNNNYYYYNNNAFIIPNECKTIEEDSPATLAFKK